MVSTASVSLCSRPSTPYGQSQRYAAIAIRSPTRKWVSFCFASKDITRSGISIRGAVVFYFPTCTVRATLRWSALLSDCVVYWCEYSYEYVLHSDGCRIESKNVRLRLR